MPVVLHRLNNATQLLASVNALSAVDRSGAVFERRAQDLAYASSTVDDLGWVLAVLACASGADVLLERRRPQGLRPILGVVRDALRRAGRDLDVPAGDPPDLEPRVAAGWQLPWAFGCFVWATSRSSPDRPTLLWQRDPRDGHWEIVCAAEASADLSVAFRTIGARLPESAIEISGPHATWSLPARWLA